MPGQKRSLQDNAPTHKSKKTKLYDNAKSGKTTRENLIQSTPTLVSEEVDFPRGGGTSFTPLEVKAIRAEAMKEAHEDLFDDTQLLAKKQKHKKRKLDAKAAVESAVGETSDRSRIEHLNYKRMTIGMKILGQIVSIQPLALIISLPNQLLGHVPIIQISSQLTNLLEAMDEDDHEELDEDHEELSKSNIPELIEIFHTGQYVRAVVTAVHAPGSADMSVIERSRDETAKASRRVELSLVPDKVNTGVQKSDLRTGFTLSAALKSIEDHGYILDFGVPEVSGFLSFEDAKTAATKLHVGQLLDVTVSKVSGNGRIFNVSVDPELFASSSISEVTNVTSIIPGTLVHSLITAERQSGLNLQILGFFEGTVDQFHLRLGASDKTTKIGTKIKARILYDIPGSPPRFALSVSDHIIALSTRCINIPGKHNVSSMQEAYPVGKTLDNVKVVRVEAERGLVVEIQPGLQGFIHISSVSDEHIPSLSSSSGPWKAGTTHQARVTGYHHFDALLNLSLKPSVLGKKFLQVSDVQVGEVVKGTIKKLADTGLFVSMSGNVDGVIWPNHYADIALKHPGKRFKTGDSIKCRVLVVDPERKRIVLTAKRTLLDSDLPILSTIEDAKIGVVAHAVVFNITEKHLLVEFYNNLKAVVPAREASETPLSTLSESFVVGKVVKVRIISVDAEASRMVASIRQAAPNFKSAVTDISSIEIGNIVEGVVSQIHKENAILTLQPSEARALISLNNLANHRSSSVSQLRASLKADDKLEDLIVVSRNPEKGFVIVANRPKAKGSLPSKSSLSITTVTAGQIVGGRVTRHGRSGAYVKLSSHLGGILHPTDTSDNYEAGVPFPTIDSILKAVIIDVDRARKHIVLSTRASRMFPQQDRIVADREINGVGDLQKGETVRGFIKSVAEHGLFVTLGRDVDARVQIKELFDEYVKDWKSRFEANQLVKGRILSIDVEKRRVEMSFRSGDLSRESGSALALGNFHEGHKIDGHVKKIADYGLFIEIEGSKISGLCHISQLSDNKDADATLALRGFRVGDRVKAIIRSIDLGNHRISFGLKPSYFDSEDAEGNKGMESDAEDPESEPFGVVEEGDNVSEHGIVDNSDDEEIRVPGDEGGDIMQIDEDNPSLLFPPTAASPENSIAATPKAALKLQGGFQWSADGALSEGDLDTGSDSTSDENDGDHAVKKKRRRKEIEQDHTADMHSKVPESNADFERLLLGSPNSSYLWVQYMSFQLQLSEVDKAREIGKRALQTISFREEQEKLNVWIALLNVENVYGTDESLDATFKESARHNDSKTVHLRLAFIYVQAEKHEKAEEQYKRTCKKFGQSSKVWTLFGEYYLRRGELEEARRLLPRCLQSLDKRKHLKTISKFAQLEYKFGDPERGKTVFEGIVDSHPKRWDLWSIYMDMEAAQGDIQSLRNIFDRVLAMKMTSHKAKSFFKKWLDLERRLGDEDGETAVKQKAVEWTKRIAS